MGTQSITNNNRKVNLGQVIVCCLLHHHNQLIDSKGKIWNESSYNITTHFGAEWSMIEARITIRNTFFFFNIYLYECWILQGFLNLTFELMRLLLSCIHLYMVCNDKTITKIFMKISSIKSGKKLVLHLRSLSKTNCLSSN